ncbi:ferrochelatase [Bacteriovorax sp. BSW11_IV]|uniref:ferrochelatase n=1 Tax=Bacteriovorax sp. BSW11_IV TaxID=1353529 RepID=UPI00038A26B9|nr:ferrochelatase [Bacteriovorax sp. BSW11_IV]EQC46375.1 ferrochelatase [Bacteriovorax sp. BSW11_IV]
MEKNNASNTFHKTLPATGPKTKVVFVQLGSPKSPKIADVRTFLKEFLGDPRVVDINPTLWKLILNLFVLPFRPKRSAKLYSRIWDGRTFPLIEITRKFSDKVKASIKDKEHLEINHAFLLSSPTVKEVYSDWEDDLDQKESPATELLAIPMFPQYSESTVASGIDGLFHMLKEKVRIPHLRVMSHFHTSKAFIDNSVRLIVEKFEELEKNGLSANALVLSFHGIPKRRVIYKKDPYYQHCFETYKLIKDRLPAKYRDLVHMTFQSRFGSEEWLTPYTDEYICDLVKEGKKHIVVYAPSFVADCLETIDELGHELVEEVSEHGGVVHLVPCLNDDQKWCEDFASFVENQTLADITKRKEDFYYLEKEDYMDLKQQKMQSPPLSSEAKSVLKIIFLTLFLDLIGFSIIFPLFPALAKHYLTVDGDNYFLKLIFGAISSFANESGHMSMNAIVLFGGALGALYSLLQFVASPIWGSLSDRYGRKPILSISIFFLGLSYVLWFFSGSFTLLILARFIGGIMGGNISTATAVVADITTKENRSKGMAIIGIAFALGFIIGPAMGGIFSLIDLTKIYPVLADYGVNPFSMPALIAAVLSFFNLFYIVRRFKETLPEEKRGRAESERTTNPLKLFAPLPYKGVNLTNFGYFFFLTAFSGMEFTLTFLAVERLGYSSMDNAYMFIFIGLIIALIQGGVVRRSAHKVGEKKMAIVGLISLIPGLLLIGNAYTSGMVYFGLFFLSVGSAMAIPCLTGLVSLYTPSQVQGRSIGIFRSLGALARVVGPIVASLVYWRIGSSGPYIYGAFFLIVPIIMLSFLPKVESTED